MGLEEIAAKCGSLQPSTRRLGTEGWRTGKKEVNKATESQHSIKKEEHLLLLRPWKTKTRTILLVSSRNDTKLTFKQTLALP